MEPSPRCCARCGPRSTTTWSSPPWRRERRQGGSRRGRGGAARWRGRPRGRGDPPAEVRRLVPAEGEARGRGELGGGGAPRGCGGDWAPVRAGRPAELDPLPGSQGAAEDRALVADAAPRRVARRGRRGRRRTVGRDRRGGVAARPRRGRRAAARGVAALARGDLSYS